MGRAVFRPTQCPACYECGPSCSNSRLNGVGAPLMQALALLWRHLARFVPHGVPAGPAASHRPLYSVRNASMGSVLAALRAGIIAAAKAAAASARVVTSKTMGS